MRSLAASLMLLVGGQTIAQGLPAATAQELVAGTRSCVAATSESGVDVRKLEADGWRPATVTGSGAPAGGLFYGKGDLLLTLSGSSAKICFISARIADTAAFSPVGTAMNQGLGSQGAAKPDEANTAYWFPANHIVQLKLTGKPEAPAVRIAVGYHPAEKK